jgi:hypothetical protein
LGYCAPDDPHALSRAAFPGSVTGAFIPNANSPGTFAVEGNVVLDHDTVLEMELAGALAGDQLLEMFQIPLTVPVQVEVVWGTAGPDIVVD